MSAPVPSAGPVAAPVTPASIGRRVGAYVIDGVVYGLIATIAVVVATLVAASTATGAYPVGTPAGVLVAVLIVLVVSLGWGVVFTGMQGGGGSIGQRLTGIRLADAGTGAPLGFWRALLRNIVWALLCSVVVGYFTPLFDTGRLRRGWHDMAANAVVANRGAAPVAPAAAPAAAPVTTAAPVVAAPNPFLASAAAPAAPAPMPTTFAPASPAGPSALPVASSGLIASVPGVSVPVPATAPTPVASGAAPAGRGRANAASAAPVASPAPPRTDEVDLTRAVPPRPGALIALIWDDGTRIAVHGRTLFGRNPEREEGAAAVAVRDETLSLSKTHFEVGGDASGVWLVDRHSTNGTVLVRGGVRETVVPGVRVPLRPGDRLEFGDRSVTTSADEAGTGAM